MTTSHDELPLTLVLPDGSRQPISIASDAPAGRAASSSARLLALGDATIDWEFVVERTGSVLLRDLELGAAGLAVDEPLVLRPAATSSFDATTLPLPAIVGPPLPPAPGSPKAAAPPPPTPPPPPTAPPYHQPPFAPPAPHPATANRPSPGFVAAIVGAAALVVAVGIGAGVLLIGGHDATPSTASTSTPSATVGNPCPPNVDCLADGPNTPTVDDVARAALVDELYDLAKRSRRGRELTAAGFDDPSNYAAAAKVRRAIVRDLDALDRRTTDLAGLRRDFRAAMLKSAQANETFLRHGAPIASNPVSYDANLEARDAKAAFRARFRPYTDAQGLDPIREADF